MEGSKTDAGEFDEFSEWRRLDAQARAIAERLLAQGRPAVQRLGPQMDRYKAAKKNLENLSYLRDLKVDADGDRYRRWERGEWRRLTEDLHAQARAIADQPLAQGPAAVLQLAPRMNRYREVKKELEKLSYGVAGTHSQSLRAPNW
ncbi:MAG: hypothetical protein JWO49_249 [Arthrobacter sp.]|nr:hypothetical protein [Arthrobacter sp.]MCU1548326.1 hypothetical protein [Arthrobacter sp.]